MRHLPYGMGSKTPYTRTHFLLSLLEDLSIDIPSHFITSIIDVYQDTATHDKLIFPSAITQILSHFSIPILDSPYYTTMGAIDASFIQRSEAQLQLKWPLVESTGPVAPVVPSTFALSSSTGEVTLEAIMA